MPMRKIWNNQYEQLRKIGEGASGRVMLARDLHLNRLVAIKEMEQIREIRREMELLKALKHPGLPDIYDYFEEDRHGFLVMEYVEGVTLKEYLEQHGKPELTQAIVWMKELLDILVYLHEQHPAVVYRDLKPANLIIQEEGHLKLIDLGGAFFRCHNQSEERVSIGTPGYSAPEQWNGIQADVSCDIFSFGAVAHELLTGVNPLKPPYERRPVRRYDRRIPVSYEQMIQKCTREHPMERYASMREVLKALEDCETIKRRWKWKGLHLCRCLLTAIPVTMGALLVILPLLNGIPRSSFPDPFLRKPILCLLVGMLLYLILFRLGKRKGSLLRQEKEVWLTAKKGIGLWSLGIGLLLGGLAFSLQQQTGVRSSFAAGKETFWVDMKDENDRLLLVKEGTVLPVGDKVRLEIPMERMPRQQMSLQIIAIDEKGEVIGSRIIRIKAED